MKSKKKVLGLLVCAVLLVVGSVMGTLAYLTADTGVVNNTFTVGDVAIELDEADVDQYGDQLYVNATEGEEPTTDIEKAKKDADGNAVEVERVDANTYKLIPGHNYLKDPKVYVTAGSEPSYVFVKVVNGLEDIEADTKIAAQMTANGWTALNDVDNVYYYNKDGKSIVDAREGEVTLPVFKQFTLTGTADVAKYADATITIDAYAVQADGFDSAAAAWTAAPATWEN